MRLRIPPLLTSREHPMTSFEQFQTVPLANLETLFGLSAKALEGAEKLTALNLQTAKRLLSEAQETTEAAASSKTPQELIAQQFSAQAVTHAVDKAIAYWRHAYEIVTATADEITKLVEVDANEAKTKWLSALDAAVKKAPAGTENVVTLMKTAIDGASHAYDGMQKATKQATEAAETSFEHMTDSALKSAAGAASKGKQRTEA
jgi:phasin family protein